MVAGEAFRAGARRGESAVVGDLRARGHIDVVDALGDVALGTALANRLFKRLRDGHILFKPYPVVACTP